jgi:4-hydroxy-tetrahydrodipicolinate synthase
MLEKGVYVSLVTPFLAGEVDWRKKETNEIDWPGFEQNIEFQIASGIDGILFVEAINGESATLSPQEHCLILERGIKIAGERTYCLAGTGSNSLIEALEYTGKAWGFGYKASVQIAPYCNPVSSYDIRENHFRKIAGAHLLMDIYPQTVLGRTAVIEPSDLALLEWKTPNICASIEIGNHGQRIKEIKDSGSTLPDFGVFSGDDVEACEVINEVRLDGVFSVIANIAPKAVCSMFQAYFEGNNQEAERIRGALSPILVSSIKQERSVFLGRKNSLIVDEVFNPVIIKTMMNILGMPAGCCRFPLGGMDQKSFDSIKDRLKTVWQNNGWVLKPLEDFYGIDISQRLQG